MKKIRINKDISIRWTILTNGESVSLVGRDLKLVLTDPIRRTTDMEFTVEGNTVTTLYKGTQHKCLGDYTLTLWENYGKDGQTAADACNAFTLVPTTCAEGGEDEGLDTETVELSGNIEVLTQGIAKATTDYNDLENKPTINDVELSGNKTLEELGIQPKGDYLTAIPEEYVTDDELSRVLGGYATSEEIPDVSGFLTETRADGKYQPIGNYALKSEIPDTSQLATKTELSAKADKVSTENVSETTKELQPNKYYIFGEVETLTLTLAEGEENKLAEYMFEFTSGTTPTTITEIAGVEWIGDTIEANKVYQASISRGIGILIGRAKA